MSYDNGSSTHLGKSESTQHGSTTVGNQHVLSPHPRVNHWGVTIVEVLQSSSCVGDLSGREIKVIEPYKIRLATYNPQNILLHSCVLPVLPQVCDLSEA